MYNIGGFLARSALANNNPRVVAPLGELSAYAMTFARDRRIYSTPDYPSVVLFAFSSFQEISATERQNADVPSLVQTLAREIGQRLYALADAGDLSTDEEATTAILLNEFGDRIKSVVCGTMVNDGNRWMPSYIIYEGTSTTAPYTARFWFSDASFRQDFDEYEINVVPILDNIDDLLFSNLDEVTVIAAEQMSQVIMADKARLLQDGDPYTDLVATEYEWRQQGRPDQRLLLTISIIVYGEAGLNPDRRRKAIADWILEHSEYNEDAWREVLPDVFSPTEFIFIPSWNRYSLPSGTIQDWSNGGEWPVGVLSAGTYQSGGNVKNQIDFAVDFAKGTGYTPEHIAAKLNMVVFVYKAIMVNIIGGYRNRDGVDEFLNRWKDYMAVGTGSPDFARMSEGTQEMIVLLVDMLRIAETMTITSTIPRNFMRLVRDGVLYLAADYERTQILVATRQSVSEVYQYTTGSANVKRVDEGGV